MTSSCDVTMCTWVHVELPVLLSVTVSQRYTPEMMWSTSISMYWDWRAHYSYEESADEGASMGGMSGATRVVGESSSHSRCREATDLDVSDSKVVCTLRHEKSAIVGVVLCVRTGKNVDLT